jgi:hypothetical protein
MNGKKTIVSACALLAVMTFGLFAVARERTEDKMVNLNDCDWTVTKIRSEASVMREIPACVGATRGVNKEFKSEKGPLSVITVILNSRKTGELELVPELFLVRDGGLHGIYRLCQGVRVVDPKPRSEAEAFHPPSDGGIWPGHAGQLRVTAGQSVVIELLFMHIFRDDAEILAASPAATVKGLK